MPKIFLSIVAGPGIALATAQRFAREGYAIVLAARNAQRLARCAAEIEAAGGKAEIRQVDASDPKAVAALVESLGADLHVLHYNAGVLHYDANAQLMTRTLDDESVDSLVNDMQVNVASALVAMKAAMPAMQARQSGSLLVTGGGLAFGPSGNYLTLSVGKSALRAAVLALCEPLEKQGIHVASVIICHEVLPGSEHVAAIADEFWRMHAQPRGQWTFEALYGKDGGPGHNVTVADLQAQVRPGA